MESRGAIQILMQVKKTELQNWSSVNSFWAAEDAWYSTWNGEDAAMQIDWVKVSQ